MPAAKPVRGGNVAALADGGIGWVDPVASDLRKRRPRGKMVSVAYVVRELEQIDRDLSEGNTAAEGREKLRAVLRLLTSDPVDG
jgi:hypothetical protein